MIKNRDKLEAVDFDQQCFKLDKIHCNLIKSNQNANGSTANVNTVSIKCGSSSTSTTTLSQSDSSSQNIVDTTNCVEDSSSTLDSTQISLSSQENSRPFEQPATNSIAESSPLVKSLSIEFVVIESQSTTTTMATQEQTEQLQKTVDETSPIRPLVFCGPSGSGKSTLLKKLMREYENCFGFSISHTTRKPRNGEINGKDYNFVEREEILKAIENGDFIEHAEFAGNIYGTSKKAVKDVLEQEKICLLDIDIEGVKNLKKTDLKPVYIFVKPPSIEVLEQRLRSRGSETDEKIKLRLQRAVDENAYGDIEGNFDIVIVNDDFDEAYDRLRTFVENHFKINRKNVENLNKSPKNLAPSAV